MKLFSIQKSEYPRMAASYSMHFQTADKVHPYIMLPISQQQYNEMLPYGIKTEKSAYASITYFIDDVRQVQL